MTLRHWDSLLRTAPDSSGDVENVPDMVGKTVVRDESGDAALRRVALAEYVEVGTNSTGKARLQPGTPTVAGQLQIHPTTGLPYIYLPGTGPVLAYPLADAVWPKNRTDSSPSDVTEEISICGPPGVTWWIDSVSFIPNGVLTLSNTDYGILSVRVRSAEDGTSDGLVALGNTTVSGANSTTAWTAHVPVALTLQPAANFMMSATQYLTVRFGKFGAGVVIPAGLLVVKRRVLVE